MVASQATPTRVTFGLCSGGKKVMALPARQEVAQRLSTDVTPRPLLIDRAAGPSPAPHSTNPWGLSRRGPDGVPPFILPSTAELRPAHMSFQKLLGAFPRATHLSLPPACTLLLWGPACSTCRRCPRTPPPTTREPAVTSPSPRPPRCRQGLESREMPCKPKSWLSKSEEGLRLPAPAPPTRQQAGRAWPGPQPRQERQSGHAFQNARRTSQEVANRMLGSRTCQVTPASPAGF